MIAQLTLKMIAQPTLKQLKYLCAIAKTQHFGQAARDCYISQSALSAGMHELEEHLGVSLLERTNKRVYLTRLGKEVVSCSQDILTQVADLVSLCKVSEEPFSHELRLGVIPTIAPYLLPSLMGKMRNAYPGFKLSLREDLSRVLIECLNNGELDVLLLALPYPSQGADTLHLFYDDFLLVCPNNHPLTETHPLRLDDLNNQDLLLLKDDHCLRDHALEACKLDVNELSVSYQATSLNTLVQMVANGMGITLLPKMAIDSHILVNVSVTVRPFLEKKVWRSIGLLWRKTSPRTYEFELLGSQLQELWGNSP